MSSEFDEFMQHADRDQFKPEYADPSYGQQPQQQPQQQQQQPQQQQYRNNYSQNNGGGYNGNNGGYNRNNNSRGGNQNYNRNNGGGYNRGGNQGYKRNNDRFVSNIKMEDDGVAHINVYTRAKTELGRDLSHFSLYGFTHPIHGTFLTLEGYWHWLNTGMKEDKFRRVYGSTAKKMVKEMEQVRMPFDEFKAFIRKAHVLRLEQNFKLKAEFIKSTLPFMHYYWYGQEPNVNVVESKSGWIIEMLEELRTKLKAENQPG